MATSTPRPSREHPVSSLLSRAHSPTTTAQIFRDKVTKQPLLLRPSSPDPKSTARDQRRTVRQEKAASLRRSKKPKPLSAAQKRKLQIYDIPREQRKYATYEPMHAMWCAYIRKILGLEGAANRGGTGDVKTTAYVVPSSAGPMLASADFHGALVEVVRSRCVGRVGIKGIVLKDTKFTFEIITAKNEVKRVPKEHTVFRFELPLQNKSGAAGNETDEMRSKPLVFELHGSQFEMRAPDRANKKFKMHIDPDL
ncbi:hypothetical protein AAFC00_007214 [Neodothiora populina]|uniref:Ribonuclease P protein subunit n=1 Tax=Neodothiora populina TaxID=2781224 RepID=A0ABR3PHI7_9PEZI